MGMGKRGLPLAVFSDEQKNGRGQQGKNWISDKAKNIMCTVGLPLDESQNIEIVSMNKALSVSILQSLKEFVQEPIFLKWPNDIVTQSHKLGGLLMEIVQIEKRKFLLLGIGINVNQTSWNGEPKATSLSKINGYSLEISAVMNAVLLAVDEVWKNTVDYQKEYRESLWNLGQQVVLEVQSPIHLNASAVTENGNTTQKEMTGLLQDVDPDGRIVIVQENGTRLGFHHGQVRLRF